MHKGDQTFDFFFSFLHLLLYVQISWDTVDLYEDLEKIDDLEDFGDDDDEADFFLLLLFLLLCLGKFIGVTGGTSLSVSDIVRLLDP